MLDDRTATPLPRSPWSTIGAPARTARDRILATATELFCTHGFATVGVDTISQRSGAAKSTLYKHFASKEELIEAVLEVEGAAWRKWFFSELSRIEGGPRERLLGVFDVLHMWFADPRYYGCPFLNAISEASCDDPRPRKLAESHKAPLKTWLHAQALELGLDAEDLTSAMVVLIDGAIMASHAARDPQFAKSAQNLARSHFSLVRSQGV